MERSSKGSGLTVLRMVLLAVGLAGLLYCGMLSVRLYSDIAPFNQMYYDASPEQDRQVSVRLVAALVGLPVSAVIVWVAGAWGLIFTRPRRWVGILALVLLAASVQACGACGSLPYGFGSSYEHATAEQHWHLKLSRWTAVVCLGAATVVWSLRPKGSRAAEPPGEPMIH